MSTLRLKQAPQSVLFAHDCFLSLSLSFLDDARENSSYRQRAGVYQSVSVLRSRRLPSLSFTLEKSLRLHRFIAGAHLRSASHRVSRWKKYSLLWGRLWRNRWDTQKGCHHYLGIPELDRVRSALFNKIFCAGLGANVQSWRLRKCVKIYMFFFFLSVQFDLKWFIWTAA